MHGPEEEPNSTSGNAATVALASLDGLPEMNADVDPRQAVLIGRLGEARIQAVDRARVGTRAAGREREAARGKADVVRAEEPLQYLGGDAAFHGVTGIVVRNRIGELQWCPRRIADRQRIPVGVTE